MKRLSFICSDDAAVAIINLAIQDISELHMEGVPDAPEPKKKRRVFRGDEKGLNQRCLEIFEAKPDVIYSVEYIGKQLAKLGFSKTSASACISRLVRSGEIVKVRANHYKFNEGIRP